MARGPPPPGGGASRHARQAGVRDFHFHDLCHHGATKALTAGFSPSVVMDLGGWTNHATMRRYAAVTNRTLRAAAEAVSGVNPALEGGPARTLDAGADRPS